MLVRKELAEQQLHVAETLYDEAAVNYSRLNASADAEDCRLQKFVQDLNNTTTRLDHNKIFCEYNCSELPELLYAACVNSCISSKAKRKIVFEFKFHRQQIEKRRDHAYANRDLAWARLNSINATLNAAASELQNLRRRIIKLEIDIAELEAKEKQLQEIVRTIAKINKLLFASFNATADFSIALDSLSYLISNLQAIEEPRKQLDERFKRAGIQKRIDELLTNESDLAMASQTIEQIKQEFANIGGSFAIKVNNYSYFPTLKKSELVNQLRKSRGSKGLGGLIRQGRLGRA